MHKLMIASLITYSFITCYFAVNWLIFSRRKVDSSYAEETFLSLVVFSITTLFWPLAVMISSWKILRDQKIEFTGLFNVLLAFFIFGISYYLI
ncbi:MAG: hypothetical protein VKL59_25915 [Nostocaceae cyanobacterium]|nr:hypothetical protein [Nostocaceae cyanobacterium]